MPEYQVTAAADERPARGNVDPLITAAQAELDGYYVMMRGFSAFDMTEILANLAAFSARASEVRSHLVRQEGRRAQSFRTRELEPFLDECDRQFKVWSRLQAVRDMEFRMSGGGI